MIILRRLLAEFSLAAAVAVSLAVAFPAFADTQGDAVKQWYAYVCGDDGAVFKFLANFLYPSLVISAAAILANVKTLQRMPGVGLLLNLAGANWASWLRKAAATAAKSAPALLLLCVLAGCAGDKLLTFKPTGNVANDLATVQSDVQSDVTAFNQKAAAFNAGAVKDAIAVGTAACPLLAKAHAAYGSALGQVAVQAGAAAAGAPAAAAAGHATEAVVYADIQKGCAVVAAASAADAASPTAAEIVAVQGIVADVPKLQSAIAKVLPTAAQLVN